jgi:hypothetical protein
MGMDLPLNIAIAKTYSMGHVEAGKQPQLGEIDNSPNHPRGAHSQNSANSDTKAGGDKLNLVHPFEV